MPSTYAHYQFGQEVQKKLPEELSSIISHHMPLYQIGLHGPDILFYYHALFPNSVNHMAYRIHEKKASYFIRKSLVTLKSLSNPEAGLAYMFGFICHFALDSECHSYIEFKIRQNGITHTEIETDFDRRLLLDAGKDPVRTCQIWMLPVSVNVFALLAKRATLEENGFALPENMTWEEYRKILLSATKEQTEQIFLTNNMSKLYFCEQYFSHYRTLENDLFAESITALSEIWKTDCGGKVTMENILWQPLEQVYWMRPSGKEVPFGLGEDAVVVSLPKLAAADKNIASCTYLAVNPDSARRDEVLAYLADLIAYLMRGTGMPYFTDWTRENMLDEALYEVYANGEIAFAIDRDVYGEGLEEMLSGT